MRKKEKESDVLCTASAISPLVGICLLLDANGTHLYLCGLVDFGLRLCENKQNLH